MEVLENTAWATKVKLIGEEQTNKFFFFCIIGTLRAVEQKSRSKGNDLLEKVKRCEKKIPKQFLRGSFLRPFRIAVKILLLNFFHKNFEKQQHNNKETFLQMPWDPDLISQIILLLTNLTKISLVFSMPVQMKIRKKDRALKNSWKYLDWAQLPKKVKKKMPQTIKVINLC